MDREKVIKGLECCLMLDSPCEDCPYYSYEDIQELDCERNLRHDAIDYINNSKEEAQNGKRTYVCLEDIQKFPLRKNHYDKENGNKHFIYGIESLMEYIESLPKFKIEDQPFTQSNEWHINASVLSNPDIEAMAKRDDFLSDENGEKLNKAFQSLWGDD